MDPHAMHMKVQPVSPETSSQLWAQRCSGLKWSSEFPLRHPPTSSIADAACEGLTFATRA
eukprot:9467773-Pyramimonas_sp.AAC.1